MSLPSFAPLSMHQKPSGRGLAVSQGRDTANKNVQAGLSGIFPFSFFGSQAPRLTQGLW